MKNLSVDYSKTVAQMKPMHACGSGPKQGGARLSFNATEQFKDIGIPYCRLHDIEGYASDMQYVDVHNIFPDWDADVNDHKSYNFGPTDRYLLAIRDAGAKVFFRLGCSIEHYERKLFIFPPKDYQKFAKICENIVRHYNYLWCQGHYMEIDHWEIWNEPESHGMWQGTHQEFYELYRVVANHLKKCFPTLKIGGYSALGFYTETREQAPYAWFKMIVPFLNGFFDYITAEETKAPLDFFSWHCYAENPEEINKAAVFIRNYLNDRGFTDTESYLTEYNTFQSLGTCPQVIKGYAAEIGAGLITAQNSPMEMMFYYDMRIHGMNGIIKRTKAWYTAEPLHGYYAMKAFGDLYRLKNQVESEGGDNKVYILSATDGDECATMLAVRDYEGDVEILIKGTDKTDFIIGESSEDKIDFSNSEVKIVGGKLIFRAKKDSIYYIKSK